MRKQVSFFTTKQLSIEEGGVDCIFRVLNFFFFLITAAVYGDCVISAFRRLRPEDRKFDINLIHIISSRPD